MLATRPPGRPRRFDQSEALEAALHVFWRCGYAEASMSALREAMGMSSASIENAFGSKPELFARVLEHYFATYGTGTEAAADLDLAPREALRQALLRSLAMQSDSAHPPGCLVALSSPTSAQRSAEAVRLGTEARNVTRERLRVAVARGVDSGDLPEHTDVEALTATFDAFLLGLSTEVCDGVPADVLNDSIDLVMRVWDSARE